VGKNRALVMQAIDAHGPARDALDALIDFVTRERPKLSPVEAEFALDVRRVNEWTLTGTSDGLVLLLASLAGISVHRLPL
jgi:hypothetical protein